MKRDITEVLGEEEVRQVIQKLLQPPQETKEALATATQNVPLFLRVIRTYYSNQGSSSGKHQQTNTTAEASKRAEKVINQVTEERSLDGHQKAAAMQGVLYVLQRLAYNDANQNLAKEICGEIGLPESYVSRGIQGGKTIRAVLIIVVRVCASCFAATERGYSSRMA